MSVDICCLQSAFQVVVRKPGKKSKLASPQKDLRERVIAALFATLHDELVPSLSFEDVVVPSSPKDTAGSQNPSNKLSDAEMALEDPSPSGVDFVSESSPISSEEIVYEEEEEIDDDFVYYGSRANEEDDFDYEDAFFNACHDIADEYEEKFFRGRKNSRMSLNQTLRSKKSDKIEKVNPKRRVKACEVAKKEMRESNIAHHNEIRKQKSMRKYSHLIPVPPWVVGQSDASYVPAARSAVLNPSSRVEEERQLSLAIQQSRQTVHASGLTMQQILELTTRELTPEDYEMLLQLDSLVEKKTLSKKDVNRFKQCTLAEAGPHDEPCVICFNTFAKGEKQTELPCTHKYHSSCIETWLTQSGTTCPLCGVSLD
eukprot:TRINITY_DN3123_c0_g1_i1.p1 TRINITY_DN3123_c0_g1~~TRINITY_DN3123_c0_g1_i1.p1  ORF type:complete len:371 (+),score=112.69 TRINITY_DN3123_c0_g1_i1:193-1305(+)